VLVYDSDQKGRRRVQLGVTLPLHERIKIKAKWSTVGQRVRLHVERHPLLFYSLYGLRPKIRRRSVNRSTRLVIEGFPRSGNTFAVVAFDYAQQETISIAHHLHAPAQVIRAAQWQIPALVLIRDPVDASASLMVRHPEISASQALRSYISFYDTIAKYRQTYVLGTFEEVVEDYGKLIERVNDKFDTQFSCFNHSEDNVRRVFSRIDELRVRFKTLSEGWRRKPSAYGFR
jgi:hypothetical protein